MFIIRPDSPYVITKVHTLTKTCYNYHAGYTYMGREITAGCLCGFALYAPIPGEKERYHAKTHRHVETERSCGRKDPG